MALLAVAGLFLQVSAAIAQDSVALIGERLVTESVHLARLRSPRGEWKREYAAAVDSILPFAALKAHFGGDPWNSTCGAPQARIYVRDSAATPIALLAPRGVASVERVFRPVTRVDRDSSGWQLTRLSWEAFYYDYGGTAQIDFWTRPVRDRLVTLVFMYTPYVAHHRAMLTRILESATY